MTILEALTEFIPPLAALLACVCCVRYSEAKGHSLWKELGLWLLIYLFWFSPILNNAQIAFYDLLPLLHGE